MSNLTLNNGNIKLAYFALLLACQLAISKIVIYGDPRVFTDGPGIGMGTVIYNEHIGNPTEATTEGPWDSWEEHGTKISFNQVCAILIIPVGVSGTPPSGMKAYQ